MKLGLLTKERRSQEWLTPRYQEYLRSPNPSAEADFALQILSRPERDRSIGWSASSAGTCIRAQLYKARRAEATPYTSRLLAIFQNGHYVHLKHQTAGLVAGYLTETEVPVRIDDLNVRGTMDGMTSIGEVAEFKSIHTRGFSEVKQFSAQYKHLRQVNAYMVASGAEVARILYEDKNTQDLCEYRVERDPQLIEANYRDWEDLNRHQEDQTLPPMLPQCQVREGEYKTCPFAKVCMADHLTPKSRIRRTSSSAGD